MRSNLTHIPGQKMGHPLNAHQPTTVKDQCTGMNDGMEYVHTLVNVRLSHKMIYICPGLHKIPHGDEANANKALLDHELREAGVPIVDIPLDQLTFEFPMLHLYRDGTPEVSEVSSGVGD